MIINYLDLEYNWDFLKVVDDTGKDVANMSYTGMYGMPGPLNMGPSILIKVPYQRLAFHFISDPVCCVGKGFFLRFRAFTGILIKSSTKIIGSF